MNDLEHWITGLMSSDPDIKERDLSPVLNAIEERVGFHLDNDPGLLMSYLYRLDVEESLVRRVLDGQPSASIVQEIAKLIFERQMKRVRTKQQFGKSEITDEDWSW